MVLKKGTKLTDNPKDTTVKVRMDKETIKKLDECAKKLGSNRSAIIREGVEKIYNNLKK